MGKSLSAKSEHNKIQQGSSIGSENSLPANIQNKKAFFDSCPRGPKKYPTLSAILNDTSNDKGCSEHKHLLQKVQSKETNCNKCNSLHLKFRKLISHLIKHHIENKKDKMITLGSRRYNCFNTYLTGVKQQILYLLVHQIERPLRSFITYQVNLLKKNKSIEQKISLKDGRHLNSTKNTESKPDINTCTNSGRHLNSTKDTEFKPNINTCTNSEFTGQLIRICKSINLKLSQQDIKSYLRKTHKEFYDTFDINFCPVPECRGKTFLTFDDQFNHLYYEHLEAEGKF